MPLGIGFAFAFLLLAKPNWASLSFSLPLVVGGLMLRAWAAGTLKKKAALATTGPYAYTRNPLYLGSLSMALGFALAGAVWPFAVVLVALFLAVYLRTIKDEERYLDGRFPEFAAYRATVPRMLPRLAAPKRGAEAGRFSRAQYLKNREYEALCGAVAVYAILAARLLLGF